MRLQLVDRSLNLTRSISLVWWQSLEGGEDITRVKQPFEPETKSFQSLGNKAETVGLGERKPNPKDAYVLPPHYFPSLIRILAPRAAFSQKPKTLELYRRHGQPG